MTNCLYAALTSPKTPRWSRTSLEFRPGLWRIRLDVSGESRTACSKAGAGFAAFAGFAGGSAAVPLRGKEQWRRAGGCAPLRAHVRMSVRKECAVLVTSFDCVGKSVQRRGAHMAPLHSTGSCGAAPGSSPPSASPNHPSQQRRLIEH